MTTPPHGGSFRLPELPGGVVTHLWQAIFDLCDQLPVDRWVLIGGQMVMAHGLATGRTAPRVSRDIDLMADIITTSAHPRGRA